MTIFLLALLRELGPKYFPTRQPWGRKDVKRRKQPFPYGARSYCPKVKNNGGKMASVLYLACYHLHFWTDLSSWIWSHHTWKGPSSSSKLTAPFRQLFPTSPLLDHSIFSGAGRTLRLKRRRRPTFEPYML